jgi:ABC-type uncharacterized transport system fused permease/ATPase subunit
LDAYNQEAKSTSPEGSFENGEIGFRNARFTWVTQRSANETRRDFELNVEGELLFKPGCVNLILGPTASGKTSMLMALLSEMHYVASDTDSWYNLPRGNGVAYAAQESWVQNATIRVSSFVVIH